MQESTEPLHEDLQLQHFLISSQQSVRREAMGTYMHELPCNASKLAIFQTQKLLGQRCDVGNCDADR